VSGLVLGESAFLSPAAAVEAVAPGGTVRIASGTYLPTHSVPGKHEIHIRNDVTLIGDGAQNTYLDGNDIGLLILVDAGAAATIRDLTLTRAFDYDDLADGSALQVGESAQATLAFCEVTHSYGFGIISSEGNLRILHSTIRHNRSTA